MLIRRLAVAAAVVAGSLALVPAPAAQASFCKPNYNCVLTYYSDASKTVVVGRYQVDCRGQVYESGVRSDYSTYWAGLCGH
ncbi:DUF6289 family protein [Thermoactinospora rubra]|uniref:DUF6289 family protein n=1 Tax=Thermoactinospora rubra TaxID=1088767 RepID=UPI000A1084F4|nr:DUF6289 family protein [Thermoactinospora rubra]